MKALALTANTSNEWPHSFSDSAIAFSLKELIDIFKVKLEKAATRHLSLSGNDAEVYRASEVAFYTAIINCLTVHRPQGFLLGYSYNLGCRYKLGTEVVHCDIRLMTAEKDEIPNYGTSFVKEQINDNQESA